MSKPCFFCKLDSPATFDAVDVFNSWANGNHIAFPERSRFDGVRERLAWAALDESEYGAHPECALRWAVTMEHFGAMYPADLATFIYEKRKTETKDDWWDLQFRMGTI